MVAAIAPAVIRTPPGPGLRPGAGVVCARLLARGSILPMSVDATHIEAERMQVVLRRAADRSPAGLAGAQSAFADLHAAFGRQIAAWLSARVGRSDLDEVHQEIWLKAWEKLPDQFGGGNFRAWLFTIARNHLVDASRRRGTRQAFGYGGAAEEPDASPLDPDGDEPCEILVAEERGRRLRDCLDKLESGRRRVIVGRLGGEDYAVIADELGISTTQAQSWLFAAKRLLRDCVAEGER